MASRTVASYGIEFTADTAKVKQGISQTNAAMKSMGASAGKAGKQVQSFGLNLDRAATRLGSITRLGGTAGNMLSLGVSAGFAHASIAAVGFGVAVQKAISAGISFESAFAGVIKTVDATAPQLAQIREEIRGMALDIPQSAVALAGIAEVAGQLGVQAQNITQFTSTVADLGVTTNLSTTNAATGLARLINITQGSFDTIENLGSALVDLGNNSATTEAEILNMSLRIAGAGKQVGLTESDILGFAAALSSVGVRAEAGGSAISRTFIEIDKAVLESGEALQNFAEVAGISVGQFSQLWEQDAAAAVTMFAEGLGRIQEAGGDVFGTLESLELGEIRVRDALLRLAGAGTLTAESIKLSNDAFKEGAALSEEAAKRYETTQAKVDILKNSLTDLGITMFDEVKPGLDEAVVGLSDLLQAIGPVVEQLDLLEDISVTIEVAVKLTRGSLEVLTVLGPLFDKNTAAGRAFGFAMEHLRNQINPTFFIMEQTSKGLEVLEAAQYDSSEAAQEQVNQWRQATEAYQRGESALGDLITRQWGGFEATKAFEEAIESGNEDFIFQQQAVDRMREAQAQYNAQVSHGLGNIGAWATETHEAADAQNRLTGETFNLADALFAEMNQVHEISASSLAQISNASDATVAAIGAAFGSLPEITGSEIAHVVDMVTDGTVTIDEAFGVIGSRSIPELNEALGELANELSASYLEAMANGGEGAAEFADQHSVVIDILNHINGVASGAAGSILNLAAAYGSSASMVELFNDQASDFGSVASTMEKGYDILIEKQEKGLELTEREQEFLERYPQLYDRMVGGQEDAAVQAALWAAAQAELVLIQDDFNAGIEVTDGRVAGMARAIQGIGTETGIFTEEMRLALEAILDVNVGMDGLDGQEANIAVNLLEGAGSTAGSRGGQTRYEQRAEDLGITGKIGNIGKDLVDLNGSTATVTSSINDYATEPLTGIIGHVNWLKEFGSFTIHAYMDTSNFDAGTAHVAANTPHSPAEEGPLAFTPNWDWLFEGIAASAEKYTEEALEHAKNYVDTVQAMFGAFSAELDFATQAAEFETAGTGMPSEDLINELNLFAEHVLESVGDSAAQFKEEFLEHTETYASAASAGVQLFADAIEAVAGLEDFTIDLAKAKDAASQIKFLTEHILLSFGDSAAMIEVGDGSDHPSIRGEGFVGAADAYATAAKSSVELIGAGVDNLANLDMFSIDLDRAVAAASQIKFLTEEIVLSIGDSAQVVNSEIDHPSARGEGFVGIAGDYADGAKKAVELIGEGMEFIVELSEFDGRFNLKDAKEFASNLKFLIEHIAVSIGDAAMLLRSEKPEGFLTEMENFAEAVGPTLPLMSDTVGFLSDIADLGRSYVMPSLEEIQRFADDLVVIIRHVADAFREASLGWGTDPEGSEAGTLNAELLAFAEGAGASLDVLGDVFDVIEGISTLMQAETFLTTEQIRAGARYLSEQVRVIALEFLAASEGWGEVDAALTAFAEDAGNSLGLVTDAVDAIMAIVKWQEDEDAEDLNMAQAASVLTENMGLLLDAIEQIVNEYQGRGVEKWGEFATAASQSFDMVKAASDAFVSMAELSALAPKQMDIFVDNWGLVIDAMWEVVDLLQTSGLDAAQETLDLAQEIISIFNEAADLMGGDDSDGSGGSSPVGVGGGNVSSGSITFSFDPMSTFGDALDFVRGMIELADQLDMEQALDFVKDVQSIINRIIISMASSYETFAGSGLLTKAAKFNDVAGPILETVQTVNDMMEDIVKNAFLADFLMNTNIIDVWAEAIGSLALQIANAMADATSKWTGAGIAEQTKLFAETADKSLGTAAKAIDVVEKIAKWGDSPPITEEQVQGVGRYLVNLSQWFASAFDTASGEWAGVSVITEQFLESVNNSLDTVIKVVDAVDAINNMDPLSDEAAQRFIDAFTKLLDVFSVMTEALAGTAFPSAPQISTPPPSISTPAPEGNTTNNSPTINVNVNGTSDPYETAQMVIHEIERNNARLGI